MTLIMKFKTKKIYIVVFTPTYSMLMDGHKPKVMHWFDNWDDMNFYIKQFQQDNIIGDYLYTVHSPSVLVGGKDGIVDEVRNSSKD